MKLSDILLLTLFFVMGSMIFAIKKMQAANGGGTATVPVPVIKPEVEAAPLPEASLPKLRLEMSGPATAGSYGRLSLDEFLAKGAPTIDIPTLDIRDTAPKASVKQEPQPGSVIKRPRKDSGDQASLKAKPFLNLAAGDFETAASVKLASLTTVEDIRFMDQVVNMAEASPLQPDSRGCGTLNHNLKSAPKHAKVRSVGMERQITNRASIGVEYVYKDGCYKNAIAPLQSLNMPGDDGVNLRVNMRF